MQATKKPKLRVAVLGGCEEVGRNCTMIEYGNDIILVDLGIQFPEEGMPGIDYIIPNVSCLRGKEKNVRGVIITHGHLDHIGAIPHIVPHIGNPPIFALPMSANMIKKRQTDFATTALDVRTTKVTDTITLGKFKISFFHINHSIPDAVGIVIDTPEGRICHTGDWKFDFHPSGAPPADFQKILGLGNEGVLLLMGDSTNAWLPGYQLSEKATAEALQEILERAEGRVVIGMISTLVSRMKQIIELSQHLGKKVCLLGYSLRTNTEIARELGYIDVRKDTVIKENDLDKYPKEKVVIVCTGAQGESNAALMRIANDEHQYVSFMPGDTVIFASSIIPGNERSVQRLKDTLYRKKTTVIHSQMMDVHAGGHARKEDARLMLTLFRPKYYAPIEGNHFMLCENGNIAKELGWKDENIFIAENGQVMEFSDGVGTLTKEKLPAGHVFVDGLGVGDISEVILRERDALAADGILFVTATVEEKTGKIIGKPEIITRGFMRFHEQTELLRESTELIEKILHGHSPQTAETLKLTKDKIRDVLGQHLFMRTERRPMIIPVLIEV